MNGPNIESYMEMYIHKAQCITAENTFSTLLAIIRTEAYEIIKDTIAPNTLIEKKYVEVKLSYLAPE